MRARLGQRKPTTKSVCVYMCTRAFMCTYIYIYVQTHAYLQNIHVYQVRRAKLETLRSTLNLNPMKPKPKPHEFQAPRIPPKLWPGPKLEGLAFTSCSEARFTVQGCGCCCGCGHEALLMIYENLTLWRRYGNRIFFGLLVIC